MRTLFHNTRYIFTLILSLALFVLPATTFAASEWVNTAGAWILEFVGLLTGLGGIALNYAITELIVGMGQLVNKGGYGIVINNAWTLVRDLMNIAFIFGLVYVGIQIILSLNVSQARRTLGLIIIGALLVNFSLFFSKVVIEVSNVASKEIYTTITNGNKNIDISGQFMQRMGVISLYNPNPTEAHSVRAENIANRGPAFFIVGAIFLLVAAFVFFAGAILIIIRFLALIFLMIASPIAFGALAFPQTQKYAKKWWELLFKQSFFAPAYLFLLLIALQALSTLDADVDLADPIGGTLGADVIINFALAAGLMIAALMIAKTMGAYGAAATAKVGKDFRGRAQRLAGGATFGLGARLGQSYIGNAAYRISQSEKLKDRAASSWAARQQLKAVRSVAGASFDARRVGGVGKKLGVGEGKKGGYQERLKRAQKSEQEYIESLGTISDNDRNVSARKKEVDDAKKELKKLKADREGATTADEKRRLTQELQVQEQALSEAERKLEQERNRRQMGSTYDESDQGYIGNIGDRGTIYSWIQGRDRYINKQASDALRDQWEKKIKKTKEERRHDETIVTLRESGK